MSITSTVRITMLQRRKSTLLLSVLVAVSLGLAVTEACESAYTCLLNFRNATSAPKLDGRGICLASKVFLDCVKKEEAKCGFQDNTAFQSTVNIVRSRFNQLCGDYTDLTAADDTSSSGGNSCPALAACRGLLAQGSPDTDSTNERCRVHAKYISCARGAAETCGVNSDPTVVASLRQAEEQYQSLCSDVTDAKDTTKTPEPTSDRVTRQAMLSCPQFRACHSALTEAMKGGDVAALCKSMADFETCTEELKKTCNISAGELGHALAQVKDYLASDDCAKYVQPRVGESVGSATELPMSDASSSMTDIPMADASYNPTNNPKRSISGQTDGGQQGCVGVQKCITDGTKAMNAVGRNPSAICRELGKTTVCIQTAMDNCASTGQEQEMAGFYQKHFKEQCSDTKVESPQSTVSTVPRTRPAGKDGAAGGLDPNCAGLESCLHSAPTSVDKEAMCKHLAGVRVCTMKVAERCSQQQVIEMALNHIQKQEANLCGVTTTTTTTTTEASTTTSTASTPTTPMPDTEDTVVTETPDNKANSQNEAREVSSWGGISSAPSQLLTSPVLLLCCTVLALFL